MGDAIKRYHVDACGYEDQDDNGRFMRASDVAAVVAGLERERDGWKARAMHEKGEGIEVLAELDAERATVTRLRARLAEVEGACRRVIDSWTMPAASYWKKYNTEMGGPDSLAILRAALKEPPHG